MDCKLRAKNCGGCPLLGLDYAAVFGTQFAIHGSFFLYITDTLLSGYHRAGWIATARRGDFYSFHFYCRVFTFPR